MSLADHERRRLAELEQNLMRHDPGLARRVARLNHRFPGTRAWVRHRWAVLGICGVASATLLAVTVVGDMPVMRGFAILLNAYVLMLAGLLWRTGRPGSR